MSADKHRGRLRRAFVMANLPGTTHSGFRHPVWLRDLPGDHRIKRRRKAPGFFQAMGVQVTSGYYGSGLIDVTRDVKRLLKQGKVRRRREGLCPRAKRTRLVEA